MKILWSSNAPWSTSGYGNQTALTVPRLAELGHEMAINCFFGLEGGALDWNGIPCFPTDQTRFGNLLLGDYAERHFGGDRANGLVMTLMDVWVMMPGLSNLQGLKWACWTPVDHDPVPPLVTQFLQQTGARVIAMSKFGQAKLAEAGFDAMYVPHSVPTGVFSPHPELKADYREGLRIPKDAFVVGMVAMNQGLPPRKSFPQVFQAFAEFQKRRSDAILYVHADVYGRNNGVNLINLAQACGIPANKLATSDQLSLHLGIPQEMVAGVFNAFDVLAMPSFGEGFGIPLIEAQACGIPVITTDWTAMTELCGAGWLVDGERTYDATQGSWFKAPFVGEIVDALDAAYDGAAALSGQAREFALGYDTDRVFDSMWRPVMEVLERPREIAPLKAAA